MYYFYPAEKAFNHGASIWPTSVEVTDAAYAQLMIDLDNGYVLEVDENGHPYSVAPSEPSLKPITDLFQERLARLNNDYEAAVLYLKSTYPPSEVITWPVQIIEARAIFSWLDANPTLTIADMPESIAPFLVTLSASRVALGYPSDLQHLAQRVIENDALFTPALANVTAVRHMTEKEMLTAVDANDSILLMAITWTFPYPPVVIE